MERPESENSLRNLCKDIFMSSDQLSTSSSSTSSSDTDLSIDTHDTIPATITTTHDNVHASMTPTTTRLTTPMNSHYHFAGRQPAGSSLPVVISKDGVKQVRVQDGEKEEILSIGLACSECFSGPRLASILKPGFEYEQKVMMDLMGNTSTSAMASPLSIHTSGGVPIALSGFIDALEPHLPWKYDTDRQTPDWCVSLQIEGASAVWAAIDLLLQVNTLQAQASGDASNSSNNISWRKKVAVGRKSYHGPPSTSAGAKTPLWTKDYQLTYPVPVVGEPNDAVKLITEYRKFLDKHSDEIGVLVVEPQWGSSQAALPWPKDVLKMYVVMAQERGIKVLADEIMCGLGRHGQGTLFLSEAWDLNPDAVTFGKAIGGGVYPLSGAIIKEGSRLLGRNGRSVMQSHTYAGSSVRALMTGTEVLKTMPKWFCSISKLGKEMKLIFTYLAKISDGLFETQGQGLMWGGLLSRKGMHRDESTREKTFSTFKRYCEDVGVLPYFIPVGGFMVSPVVDIDIETVYKIGERLKHAIKLTIQETGWTLYGHVKIDDAPNEIATSIIIPDSQMLCSNQLQCISCKVSSYVDPMLRSRFYGGTL